MDKKVNDIIDYIKREMRDYSQVHYVDTEDNCVRFRCNFCRISCMGIQNIVAKFPLIDIYICDGILCFDYTSYLNN